MCEAVPLRPPQNFITWLMGENRLLICLLYNRSLECVELCLHAPTKLHYVAHGGKQSFNLSDLQPHFRMCGAVLSRPPQNFFTWLMGENRLLICLLYNCSLEYMELCLYVFHKTSLRRSCVKQSFNLSDLQSHFRMCGAVSSRSPQSFITWLMGEKRLLIYLIVTITLKTTEVLYTAAA